MAIFISIASYCDDLLLQTLNDCYRKASHPDQLRFGVVNQDDLDIRPQIDALAYRRQIRYLQINPLDSRGVSWARYLAYSLYDAEKYFLQIDSHMQFDAGWDQLLIEQLEKVLASSAKPLLTAYPHPFEMSDGQPVLKQVGEGKVFYMRPKPEEKITTQSPVVGFRTLYHASNEPIRGGHVAAGFLFTLGQFVEEIPYDPFLYFTGEEHGLAARAYTHGWDIFHPVQVPIYHLYKKAGEKHRGQHWHEAVESQRLVKWDALQKRGRERLQRLLTGAGLPGIYGLGKLRALGDLWKLAGVDYQRMTVGPEQPPVTLSGRQALKAEEMAARDDGRRIGVIAPTHNRPDLARMLLLQMMAQERRPDVVCFFQNNDDRNYADIVNDLASDIKVVWLFSDRPETRTNWYQVPLTRLMEEGCDVFFWCDHDDIYRSDHIKTGLQQLESHDFSVNKYCDVLYLKKKYEYKTSSGFTAHAPGGMCSSMCFNRPFAQELLLDWATAKQAMNPDQILAQVTMKKFRTHLAEANTTVYVAHSGAVTSSQWVAETKAAAN